jgi:hypothetical protein
LVPAPIVCDDFEFDYPPLAPPWNAELLDLDGVIDVISAAAYSGRGGLEARTTELRGRAAACTTFAPVTSGELWLRARVFVDSDTAPDGVTLLFVSDGAGSGVGLQARSGNAAAYIAAAGDLATTTPIPLRTWFCYEGHVTVDAAAGSVELFIDGRSVGRVDAIDTTHGGVPYTQLYAGIEYAFSTPALTARVDEVVLGRTRVPCEP